MRREASQPTKKLMAMLSLVAGLVPSCVPPVVTSHYECHEVAPDSLRALVRVVASNFRWTWTRQDSVEVITDSGVASFTSRVRFNQEGFVVYGSYGSVTEGRRINDAVASSIVQEHRIRSGLQAPAHWMTKSHLAYAGAELVSPILGESYLSKDDPFYYPPWFKYVLLVTIDLVGVALLFDDGTRDAGLYTLAGIRALRLPFGLIGVSEYNRSTQSPYGIGLMEQKEFPTLGLKLVKRTSGWP